MRLKNSFNVHSVQKNISIDLIQAFIEWMNIY